jgi:hypothetical protein
LTLLIIFAALFLGRWLDKQLIPTADNHRIDDCQCAGHPGSYVLGGGSVTKRYASYPKAKSQASEEGVYRDDK